ncbi:hypothetical protein GIB67_001640 [Kingdonia uniflora]|uniref:Rho-GAP domain-containing protein n=1 Tax=Kingdonia uniflora TaxID=39325 RepID=A0A7J7L0U2_9MAGN|nr:hypothetical protein GIB67_001640 [Kingdonia uniflora]
MTQLFRSKSCRSSIFDSAPPSPSLYLTNDEDEDEEEEEEYYTNPISTPLIVPGTRQGRTKQQQQQQQSHHQFPILAILMEALRKSLITCSVDREDICAMDIGWPTDVQHVSHVTFDRFNGFLGLPLEFQPQIPTRVPSARLPEYHIGGSSEFMPRDLQALMVSWTKVTLSCRIEDSAICSCLGVSVFGVSAGSMQCSYDPRGNSVPTILLMMQNQLYREGGLQAEGIFRINADNSQEEYVRDQLNAGVIPPGIDAHCLAGFIKAWFRELPTGVLDSLTPDQVMHCNTEEECTQVVRLLPPMESTLLDWAINLMADVVHHEHYNKMNARNIAMVFAPNMTQMADPLTALIHAVQVMNFLKTLILKTLRERGESSGEVRFFSSCSESPSGKGDSAPSKSNNGKNNKVCEQNIDVCVDSGPIVSNFTRNTIGDGLESETDSFRSFPKKGSEADDERESVSGSSTPVDSGRENQCKDGGGYSCGEGEGFSERLSWRKGVKKLCRHPVFQLSKPVKKLQASAL